MNDGCKTLEELISLLERCHSTKVDKIIDLIDIYKIRIAGTTYKVERSRLTGLYKLL